MTYCERCKNLGIVRVQNIEEKLDSLVYCTCEWAKLPSQVSGIPVINKKISDAFSVTACPLTWFLPDNERGTVPAGWLDPSVREKIHEWTIRLNEAKKFWDQWGPVFEDVPYHHMRDR